MKKWRLIFLPLLFLVAGCDELKNLGGTVEDYMQPSTSEMVMALKQALETGTGRAVEELNQQDGYFGDAAVKILFPPEAQKVANTLRDIGAGKIVDDFVLSLNRAAEDAAKEAGPIFVNAVKQMTIADARNILLGADDAATEYFRSKTRQQLYNSFQPKIKSALDRSYATKYWKDITTRYNQLPGVQDVNADLPNYAADRALDGLFLKLKDEEEKIRDNPAARTTEVMKEVFSWAKREKG
ncbi:MAG: DUF4197 domain-containing protein [Bacteroidia bacterium]